jgi:hypothetical protein
MRSNRIVECWKIQLTSKLSAVFRGPKIDKSRGCVLCNKCSSSRKRSILDVIQKAMNQAITWEEWPSIIKRYYELVNLLTNGWKYDFSHSNPIRSEVQPFFEVMNFQSARVSFGIQPEFIFCPLKIRHSSRATPKALTHSKQVIHSCRPGCFFSRRWFSWSSRTTDFLLDPIEKLVSSTL